MSREASEASYCELRSVERERRIREWSSYTAYLNHTSTKGFVKVDLLDREID